MHDTALRIGVLAMDIYTDLAHAEILEIGAGNVNGSLRTHALPTTRYVGVDIAAGDGVDVVVEPGEAIPVPNESFDLVIASSVLEHDPAFWVTFLEMCRKARDGGHIYINVPSNGEVHRYPSDNWRFYPDSGLALAKWAVSQGLPITLIESFVAERSGDIWNDFVAVFRRGRGGRPGPTRAIHDEVPSVNILTGNSAELRNPRSQSEDMRLVEAARAETDNLRQQLIETSEALHAREAAAAQAQQASDDLRQRVEQTTQALDAQEAAHTLDRHRIADLESELLQRQEEIAQTAAELAGAQAAVAALQIEVAQAALKVGDLGEKLTDANAWVFRLAGERQVAEKDAARACVARAAAERRLASAQAEIGRLEERLARPEAIRYTPETISAPPPSPSLAAPDPRGAELLAEARATAQTAAEALVNLRRETDVQIADRFAETSLLTTLLRDQEDLNAREAQRTDWLRKIHGEVLARPWWWSVMPGAWRQERIEQRLLQQGLFDARAYRERYPDVATDGMDPLRHYILHGMYEGRTPLG